MPPQKVATQYCVSFAQVGNLWFGGTWQLGEDRRYFCDAHTVNASSVREKGGCMPSSSFTLFTLSSLPNYHKPESLIFTSSMDPKSLTDEEKGHILALREEKSLPISEICKMASCCQAPLTTKSSFCSSNSPWNQENDLQEQR